MHKKNLVIWLITVVLAVFLDQISKTWASHNLNFAETMQIIPNILNFKLLYNTGAAFSSFNNQTLVLTIISFLFSAKMD
jgi:signal peptidase II